MRRAAVLRRARQAAASSAGRRCRCAGKQVAVLRLINAYRYLACGKPTGSPAALRAAAHARTRPRALRPDRSGPDREFETGSLFGWSAPRWPTSCSACKETYCGHVGVEYMHITDVARKRWLQERIEVGAGTLRRVRRPEKAAAEAADRRRNAGEIPAHALCRPEALFAGRRREPDPAARPADPRCAGARAPRKS